jgi:hypothetical protein
MIVQKCRTIWDTNGQDHLCLKDAEHLDRGEPHFCMGGDAVLEVPRVTNVSLPDREKLAEALYLDNADHEDWTWATETNPITRESFLKTADAVIAFLKSNT